MKNTLPEAFLKKMQALLGDAYEAYLACMREEAYRGFRVNTLKIDPADFFARLSFPILPSVFAKNGYYLKDRTAVGTLPYHAAGLFYVQEPSAACAITLLDPKPGMRVLDLCAAPGSKTTQIAECLRHEGLLVANEIHPRRAQILVENVERHGSANVLVLNASPADVAASFPAYFDAVLCDAPCSGEGMFRKQTEAVKEWRAETVSFCAERQKSILEQAYRCLKPGGVLVYSTCTFSKEENEENVFQLLRQHDDLVLEEPEVPFGHVKDGCLRIYPMDKGEGHFAARIRKRESRVETVFKPSLLKSDTVDMRAKQAIAAWTKGDYPYYFQYKDSIYGGTHPFISTGKCRLLRHQTLLGKIRNGRFEPGQGLFLSAFAPPSCVRDYTDAMLVKFMHGETLPAPGCKGYTAIGCDGHALGFGKGDGVLLKNHYPKNLRL